ncbi:hypothetical protein [Nioella sp. MMSF_3534]|uniref:hypothetical protein n=1 Tax=Nioella sp. MMSF_3534 TaxID=3046720 RepID=UPI00273EF1B0|nr:hypothetical protein [Nioella sp. MMSF_3534]
MPPDGNQWVLSLEQINSDVASLDNVLAMACIGAAFSAICTFEDLVAVLVTSSKAQLSTRLDPVAVEASGLFLERHAVVQRSTLGALITAIEKSGIDGRDIRYLRTIVAIRNEFIHNFMGQVPLPGDWLRYGFTLEQFSAYTRWVARHVNFAKAVFSRIMVKNELLAGRFGSYGAILWHPDFPF